MRYLDTLKKMLVLTVAVISISIVSIKNSAAGPVEDLLAQIRDNTWNTYQNVYVLVGQMAQLLSYYAQENAADGADDPNNPNPWLTSSQLFNWNNINKMHTLINGTVESRIYQHSWDFQTNLLAKQLDVDPGDFATDPAGFGPPKILGRIKNLNDIAYGTAIGIPPANNRDANKDSLGFVRTAAGFEIKHPIPDPSWQGKKEDLALYKIYFNTLTAIESFDAYVLSRIKADQEKNNQQFTLQNDLMRIAGDPNYMAQIGGQSSGKIQRQTLLFNSQIFAINMEMLNYMRQLVQAQVMTNTLLMLNNQQNEGQIIRRAKGMGPGYAAA